MGQMDLPRPSASPHLTSALPPPGISDGESWKGPWQTSLSESHGGAGTSPKVSTWKSEGSHLCLGPLTRGLVWGTPGTALLTLGFLCFFCVPKGAAGTH